LGAYKQLLAQNLSQEGLKKLRKEIYEQIDSGNRRLGLELIARNEDGVPMNERNSTVIG
jgi:hypothetical protein